MTVSIIKADCLDFLRAQPEGSIDLVFGSPPYEECRLYLENGVNMGISRKTAKWVAWMADVHEAAQRACKGLVAFVVAGQTDDYRWSAGPVLYAAELVKRGLNLRNPPIFRRNGIPGSGGPDWLRADYEWIICTTRPGKLPWSDNTAMGHPPKWAPGGAMSYRNAEGERKNARGFSGMGNAERKQKVRSRLGRNMANGVPGSTKGSCVGRRVTSGHKDGDTPNDDTYLPPDMANPGNVIECLVGGGGVMGSSICHHNEAPFPEDLAEFFILSFCPPGGLVCDPFSGSGTVAAVAKENGRHFTGCDLRQSQVDLALRRLSAVTPDMFAHPQEASG